MGHQTRTVEHKWRWSRCIPIMVNILFALIGGYVRLLGHLQYPDNSGYTINPHCPIHLPSRDKSLFYMASVMAAYNSITTPEHMDYVWIMSIYMWEMNETCHTCQYDAVISIHHSELGAYIIKTIHIGLEGFSNVASNRLVVLLPANEKPCLNTCFN